VRLLQSLKKLTPGSMRDFYGLAAEHFRRELIDLARHYYGAHGVGANHASQAGAPSSANFDPADQSDSSAELEDMCRFHEEVEKLPAELREVVSLIYYHGCEQAEIAKLLNVSVRTVQRRWQSAMIRLHGTLRETEPAPGGS
jgi:RNA polymerase sigma-70 factor (ECF subfamily)